MAETRNVAFPNLLDPVDDPPPATFITHVRAADGKLIVRGTTSDNGTVKRVRVNGKEARALAANFAEWEIRPDGARSSGFKLSAHAEDAAGNIETRQHEWMFGR